MDMAVGIVIGAAFGTIVKSFVDDVLIPPIGLLLGNVDFPNLFITLKEGSKAAGPYASLAAAKAAGAVTLNLGVFINTVISFVIVPLAVFLVVKGVNRMKRQEEVPPPPDTRSAHLLQHHPCEGPALPAVHFTVGGGNHLMTSCGHRDNKMGRRL